MSNTNIHANGLLVSMKISQWSARKYDKRVTAEVHEKHHAAADAGRYNKHLLPGDAPSYKALLTHLTATRNEHYTQTLTWSDDNQRLLPTANHANYRRFVENAKATAISLLSDFMADYPALRDAARDRLNGLYRPEDYPSVSELREKFSIAVEYTPVPSGEDFRCALSAEILQAMEADVNARVRQSTDGAMRDAWQRLYTCVGHVYERLSQPGAVFRDSLIGNARELTDVLQRLNVTGDQELERMRQDVERQIAAVSVEDLRNDNRLRESVAADANVILKSIRRIRRVDDLQPSTPKEERNS
jgi:hypothetical protein